MISKEYIAGFVDGEGYLGIIKKTSKRSVNGYYYKTAVKIAQVSKNRFILDELKRCYGGTVSKNRVHPGKNQRESVMWEITGNKAVSKLLKHIYPSLIIKKHQADILIDFYKIGKSTNGVGGKYDVIRKDIDVKKTELYKRILKLNHRGLAETE
jgi:hypothetical protein